jgi:hypothetical protein
MNIKEGLVFSEEQKALEPRAETLKNAYIDLLREKGYIDQINNAEPDECGIRKSEYWDTSDHWMYMNDPYGELLVIRKDGFKFRYSGKGLKTSISVELGSLEKHLAIFPHRFVPGEDYPWLPLVSFSSYVNNPSLSSIENLMRRVTEGKKYEDKDALIEGYNMLQQLRTLMPETRDRAAESQVLSEL